MDIIYNTNPIDYYSNNYIVLDFETTNINNGDPIDRSNRLVLSVWKYNGCIYYNTDSEYKQQLLLEHIKSSDFIVAHNAKFELGWLKRCGLPLEEAFVWCTQIAEYTIRSNRTYPISLEESCKRRGIPAKESLVSKMIKNGICPSEIPASWLKHYCVQDVLITEQLFLKQREELKSSRLLNVLYTRNLVCPALTDIEFNGMCLDKELVNILYERLNEELIIVERKLDEITGGINPRSSKQVAEFLYDRLGFAELKDRKGNPIRTKAGNRATSSEVIARLSPRNKRQREFLGLKKEQARLEAALGKSLRKFKECVEASEGTEDGKAIIYASLNQTVTRTGRLSSTGKHYKAQLQNIDRNFKPLFKARKEGWLIGEADEAQLEFRVAGELTGDNQVYEDICNAVDVHQITAHTLTEAGQRTSRQEAKSRTFKPLYGGQSGTKAEKAYFNSFKKRYSVLCSTQEEWVYNAIDSGYTEVEPTGYRFYWPSLYITESGYVEGNTSVRNYPIQYFATGEIVPIALLYLWHYSKREDVQFFLINTVHDSIVSELPQEERELFREQAVIALTEFPREYIQRVYGYELQMPYEAEVSIDTNWKISDEWREKWLSMK